MRVLLDTTYALRGPSGTGVYLAQLVPALRAIGVDVVEAANERRPPPAGGGLGSLRNLAADTRWTQVELPRRARAAGADVLHHPLPALARRCPVPQVVTVHDLAFERLPWAFDARFRRWARRAHRRAARGAAAVVAVSGTTAADVAARWGVPRQRIVVAPHGPGQVEAPGVRREPPAHWLYIGDAEPRKNFMALFDAYEEYRRRASDPLPLVVAGTAGAAYGPPREGVRIEEGADARRIVELLAGAAALVHPAFHEGFGLTPLEAMAAGTPVIAARSPGLAETCGDAARYVDPRDPTTIATALEEVGTSVALRAELAARGRARAADFSWERAARAHAAAYTLAVR